MFGLHLGRMGRMARRGAFQTDDQKILALFASGEPGAWYDPSDMPTLFQDAAGTVPVTAVEQPVGRIVGINGVVATQPTATARAKVSARVNYAYAQASALNNWVSQASGLGTAGIIVKNEEVEGHNVASVSFGLNGGSALSDISQFRILGGVTGNTYRVSFEIRTTPGKVDATLGVIGPSAGIVQLITTNNTWQTFAVSDTSVVGILFMLQLRGGLGMSNDAKFDIRKVSAVAESQAHLPYQRVNTSTDYDTVGFPQYAVADGVDDYYTVTDGGGSATGIFLSAVIRPSIGGTSRAIFSDALGNAGYTLKINAANKLELSAGNGTARTSVETANTIAANESAITQAWDDGTNLCVQMGAGAVATVPRPSVSAGTSAFTLMRDNGAASGFFGGQLYSAIYRAGIPPPQAQREAIAAILKSKAKLP